MTIIADPREGTESSVREDIPFFFGDGIFGVLHRPLRQAHSSWVICNPFGMEKTNAHRLNVEWSRALADSGHSVLRFDYRGTGDSATPRSDATVHDYIEDIGLAVRKLERITGGPCRGLIGLRLGASLAASYAAAAERAIELVMWEPVTHGGKYRDTLLRTAMANEMVNSGGRHRSREDFRRELRNGRTVSVDGFPLTAAMHDSLADVALSAQGRPTSGPIFVAQIDSRAGRPPRRAIAEMVKTYSASGKVSYERLQAPTVWLRTKTYRWHQDELFDLTRVWMDERTPKPAVIREPIRIGAGMLETTDSIERPVEFDVSGEKVWGILHEPRSVRGRVGNIVMAAAGALCRSGLFYPRLARELTSVGWRVLRFDPRGIGDSEGRFDCDSVDEVYGKVDDGVLVSDMIAALDFMEKECGSGASVLTGLCGGGITSVFTAAADDRVFGIVPLDLPLNRTPLPEPSKPYPRPDRTLWVDRISQRRGTFLLLTVRRLLHSAEGKARLVRSQLSKIFHRWSQPSVGSRRWFRECIGDDANYELLTAFQTTLAKGLPVCCVFVESQAPQLFEAALPGIQQGRFTDSSLLQMQVVSGTEHTFTMPGQTENLIRILSTWLNEPNRPWSQAKFDTTHRVDGAPDRGSGLP